MDGCPVIEAGNKKDFDLQIAKLEASSVSCDAVILKIPEGTEYVEGRVFMKDSRLRGVIIPDSVTEIDIHAFQNCIGLQSIVVDKNNPVFDSRDNCNAIYKTASNELLYSCINTVDPDSIK